MATVAAIKALDHFRDYYGDLDVSSYPGCCGIRVINSFPDYYDDSDLKLFLKGLTEEIKECVTDDSRDLGQYQIVINDEQRKLCNQSILNAGFKQIKSFKNPDTGNILFLYTKEVNQPKKVKKVVKKKVKVKRKF